MSQEPRKFLFICTGNTCRSVMAEFMLNKISRERGLDLEARSCGVAADRGFQIPEGVRRALAPQGIERVEHVAQLVTRELLGWSDLALTMTRAHRDIVVDQYPEFGRKIHVLREYAGLPVPDVEDPIGRPDSVYASCRDAIREALDALLKKHEPA